MSLPLKQNFLDPNHPKFRKYAAKNEGIDDKSLSIIGDFRTDQETGMLAIYTDIGTIKVFLESWVNDQRKIIMYKIQFPSDAVTKNSAVRWSKIDRSAESLGDLAVEILLSHKPYGQSEFVKLTKQGFLKFEQAFDTAIEERTNMDGQFDDMPLKSAFTSIDLTLNLSLPRLNDDLVLYFSGKPTEVSFEVPLPNGEITSESLISQLNIAVVIINFENALASQCPAIIEFMWENNPQLVAYYSGKPIEVEVTNAEGKLELQTRQLAVSEIADFKVALAGVSPNMAKSIDDLDLENLPLLPRSRSPLIANNLFEPLSGNNEGLINNEVIPDDQNIATTQFQGTG